VYCTVQYNIPRHRALHRIIKPCISMNKGREACCIERTLRSASIGTRQTCMASYASYHMYPGPVHAALVQMLATSVDSTYLYLRTDCAQQQDSICSMQLLLQPPSEGAVPPRHVLQQLLLLLRHRCCRRPHPA
jgi:hypothetical protein